MLRFASLVFLLLLGLSRSGRAAGSDVQGVDFFEKKIRPVLVEHCYTCHAQTAKKLRGGLLLDSREGVRKGGDSGAAVVPGQPGKSLLIRALRQEGELAMPPKGKLPATVIDDFVRWVQMGAPDPRTAGSSIIPRKVFRITEADRKHWAFQPIAKPSPPDVQDEAWCRSAIDRFILARLEEKGFRPGSPADRYTLIRRATFDLIGLPPSPEAIAAFVRDDSPRAFAKVVDRLLASKEFGVRWGRHWLDGVRYASDVDKSGLYRDWVVRAFNDDLSYFTFVRMQIAGDLISAEDVSRAHVSGASLEGVTATGMLALAVWEKVGRDLAVAEIVDSQIDVVGRQFLGLTLACARCHDHKYDPLSIQDYYALAGIFFSSHISPGKLINDGRLSDDVIGIPLLTRSEAAKNLHIDQQVSRLGNDIARLEISAGPAARLQKVRDQLKEALPRLAKANGSDQKKLAQQIEQLRAEEKKLLADRRQKGWPERPPELAAIDKLRAATAALQKTKASPPLAIGIQEGGVPGSNQQKIGDAAIYIRGDHRKPGPVVPRRFPMILAGESQVPLGRRTVGSGRLELADWMADPNNPLTARVMVNRIWLHLFREGLVRTPDNFGMLGEPPTHPQLLDYLAQRFLASRGSVKGLIRDIVLSRAYQQSSGAGPAHIKADPENRLLGRMNRKRLEYEALRDSLLFASGQLGAAGGKNALARTLYEPVLRRRIDQTRMMFDGPDPLAIVPARSTTTTAPQALFLLNSPLVAEAAKRLAEHVQRDSAPTNRSRIKKVYWRIVGRPPADEELRIGEEFLARSSWTNYLQVLFCTNEFSYLD